MVTYNDKILVPNEIKDGLDTIHPETNTGNVYDFGNGKWLNELLDVATVDSLGLIKPDGTTIKVDPLTGVAKAEIPIIQDASITQKGIVQLNNTLTSNLTTQAATANTVRLLSENKANQIQMNSATATLQNGWTGSIKYYRDDIGRVHVYGQVSGNASSNITICTLPYGYYPDSNVSTACVADLGSSKFIGQVILNQTGALLYNETNKPNSLNINFSFRWI